MTRRRWIAALVVIAAVVGGYSSWALIARPDPARPPVSEQALPSDAARTEAAKPAAQAIAQVSPHADVSLPLHLVAVATGPNVEPRAYLANVPCGEARGYNRGDSPLPGTAVVEILATEIVLETPAGLRRLATSTRKCDFPTLHAAPPVNLPPSIPSQLAEQEMSEAEREQRIEAGRQRRAAMTPEELAKYDLQANPECWPDYDAIPPGKSVLDVIPEYCY